jgi:co-chaperonin GroES (HSP10)
MNIALVGQSNDYTPFPIVESGLDPCGSNILVQIRSPRNVSKGGIILTPSTTDTIMWNEQVAKVLKIGPLAFRNRQDMSAWPEGDWCSTGDLIIIPKYGGHRYTIPYGSGENEIANFVVVKDTDVIGKIPESFDPSLIKAYV